MSYRLPDVYKHVTGRDFEETHTALKDAIGLKEILDILPPEGLYMYPKYLTPLQNIKWVGAACEEAFFKSTSKRDREHVTYYITRNKKKFKICNYENKINLSKFRVTVDYQEDLQVIRNIFKYFKPNIYFNFSDVKKLIQIKPKIFNKNAHLRKK